MSDSAKKPYLLTVLTGLNAGAQERLSKGRFTIAGEGKADFLLDDLAGPNIEIAIANGRIRLKSDRDDLAVSKTERIVPGVAFFAELPATLHIGPAIQIHLCYEAAPKKARGGLRRIAITALCLGALGFAVFAATGFKVPVMGEAVAGILSPVQEVAPDPAPVALTAVRPEPAAKVHPVAAAKGLPTLDDALQMIESSIADQGLSGLVVEASDGALRISGVLTDKQSGIWRGVRTRYEKTYAQIAPLLIKVEEVVEEVPVAIASIWMGDVAEFTTPDGDVLRVGDQTATGWTITEILSRSVSLQKGQQRALIEF